MDKKTITMSYTPDYVLEYFRNWALKQKDAPPAEAAMFRDITTMLEIARDNMSLIEAPKSNK